MTILRFKTAIQFLSSSWAIFCIRILVVVFSFNLLAWYSVSARSTTYLSWGNILRPYFCWPIEATHNFGHNKFLSVYITRRFVNNIMLLWIYNVSYIILIVPQRKIIDFAFQNYCIYSFYNSPHFIVFFNNLWLHTTNT